MLKVNKIINLTGQSIIEVEGKREQVAYMNANISTDGNQNISLNQSITNQELYAANRAEVRADMREFEDQAFLIEDGVLNGGAE